MSCQQVHRPEDGDAGDHHADARQQPAGGIAEGADDLADGDEEDDQRELVDDHAA